MKNPKNYNLYNLEQEISSMVRALRLQREGCWFESNIS